MNNLLPADYVVVAFALVMAVTGLFRGISGTIGFVAGSAAGLASCVFGWGISQEYFDSLVVRIVVVGLAALILFGLVRLVFTKFIHCLIAQPGDAIFGLFSGVFIGIAIFAVWAWVGVGLEYSYIALQVKSYL